MAFNEPVLTKRIPLDPAQRKLVGYDNYVATGGYAALRKALDMAPDDIIKLMIDSGLRGRGGAGFSAGPEVVVYSEGKKGAALSVRSTRTSPSRARLRIATCSTHDPHMACWKASRSPVDGDTV